MKSNKMKLIEIVPQGDYSQQETAIIALIDKHVFNNIPLKDRPMQIVMENLRPMGYQLIATLKERNVNVEELEPMFKKILAQRARGEEPVIEAQKSIFDENGKEITICSCSVPDLFNYGCRCGGQ